MELRNHTRFPHFRFSNLDAEGREFGVHMAKVAWDIRDDGTCVLSDEQEPFAFDDEPHGEVNLSSVRYPSDFVPFKPKLDLVLDAVAHAPNGEPASEWTSGVRLLDEAGNVLVEKLVRVTGPRCWRPLWKRELTEDQATSWPDHRHWFDRWALDEPEAVFSLPIRYEHAFGGTMARGTDDEGEPVIEAFERNPLGCGWIDPEAPDHTRPVPAPRIEDPNDPVRDPYATYAPQGLGPTPPAWLPRRPLGGTYDQAWIDAGTSRWASDYDFEFHCSSHPDLRHADVPRGPLRIQLLNLHPVQRVWEIQLPDAALACARGTGSDVGIVRMRPDTLFLDIGEAAGDDPRILQMWRMPFDPIEVRDLTLFELSDTDEQWLASQAGAPSIRRPPHPHDVAVHTFSGDDGAGVEPECVEDVADGGTAPAEARSRPVGENA